MTTITLSLERILETVYAHCAAEQLCSEQPRPVLLGRDNAAMLRRLARNVLAGDIFSLIPMVRSTNLVSEPEGDIVSFDIDLSELMPASMLRTAIEVAVATGTLASAYAGADGGLAELYRQSHDEAIRSVKRRLSIGSLPGRIKASV